MIKSIENMTIPMMVIFNIHNFFEINFHLEKCVNIFIHFSKMSSTFGCFFIFGLLYFFS